VVTVVFRGKRIRFERGTRRAPAAQQNFALAVAALLTPCALITFTLTGWSVAADMRWTSGFFVSRGIFSHWQSWLIASSVLLLVSRVLAQSIDENK
jgi:hypothetical protein